MTSVDGTNTKVIASLGDSASQVDVSVSPNSSILGFSKTGESGNAFGQNEVYLIDPNGEAAGVLIVNGANFKNTWSPDGTHLLYSVADAGDEYRASLWYSDSRGDRGGATRLRLSVKTTADKCVFASATLAYCAVPATMAAGGGSVPSPVSVPDNLYSISLPSGTSTLVAMPSVATKMNSLSVSADAKNLYYTDALGRLNSIALR